MRLQSLNLDDVRMKINICSLRASAKYHQANFIGHILRRGDGDVVRSALLGKFVPSPSDGYDATDFNYMWSLLRDGFRDGTLERSSEESMMMKDFISWCEKIALVPRESVLQLAGKKENQSFWNIVVREAYARETLQEWGRGNHANEDNLAEHKKALLEKLNIKNMNLDSYKKIELRWKTQDPQLTSMGRSAIVRICSHLAERKKLSDADKEKLTCMGDNSYWCEVCKITFSTSPHAMLRHNYTHSRNFPITIWKTNSSDK